MLSLRMFKTRYETPPANAGLELNQQGSFREIVKWSA